MASAAFALVSFLRENWPGSNRYLSAFKRCLAPTSKWKSTPISVKLISTNLEAVQAQRDEYMRDGTNNSALESNGLTLSQVSANKRKIISAAKDSPPQESSSSSDESSESDIGVQPTKRVAHYVSNPPVVHTEFFQLLRHENGQENVQLGVVTEVHGYDGISHQTSGESTSNLHKEQFVSKMTSVTPVSRFSAVDKSVLHRLERIERKVEDVLDFLKNMKGSSFSIVEKPDTCPDLPLKTFESVSTFDMHLSGETNITSLVPFLARTGGIGEKESTERVMTTIMTDFVASHFNWKGVVRKNQPSKVGLKKHGFLGHLIRKTVRTMDPGATDKGIEAAI
ncbi:unnamed protein product [Allacma fusca]|uniref:DUF4806 domain-containing protein n=1 Tax=Allacma fusca TaxID=39272 RepID=A0A8J2NMZ1_9HEXA|nr:unnamed protein product [Allacma fusca]